MKNISVPEVKIIKQLDGLTSIRFFLALSIVLFHNCEEFSNAGYYFEIISRGYCSVSGFFLLSGLILAYNYDRKYNLRAYFQNRFARIYPLYLLSLIFAFPLFLYFQYQTNANYIGTVIPISIVSVLMIQSWSVEWLSHLNPPTWSLSVEAFLYLIFPLSLLIIQRFKGISLYIIPLCFYIIIISLYLKYPENLGTGANPILHIPTFIFGIFTGILLSRNKLSIFCCSFITYSYLISPVYNSFLHWKIEFCNSTDHVLKAFPVIFVLL
ncbi:MAG: acyltransferase [Flavobacterium sp.]|nr:MAG: acyltransferase [Flavobacterium sp.]